MRRALRYGPMPCPAPTPRAAHTLPRFSPAACGPRGLFFYFVYTGFSEFCSAL